MIFWLKSIFNIAGAIADAYQAKQDAVTAREKIRAHERIRRLEARRDILNAAQGYQLTRFIQTALALPFVIYIFKIVVWDKVLKAGVTDPLSQEMTWVMLAVVSFYFAASAWGRR